MNSGPLQPYTREEALSIGEAAERTGRKPPTIRAWCARHQLGRHIGGQWAVSKVALHLFENAPADALAAYLKGDRQSAAIVAAYKAEGVPLPAGQGARHE